MNPDAFLQPDGFKDLGTYQVWLSNHVGVKRNLEPAAGREIACPDGSRGTSCPEDDEQLYLEYAAYGLFVYTADPETFRAYWPNGQPVGTNGRQGRVQGLNFGYSAFADEENKRTTDIGKPITGGKFQGQALAYAYKGTATPPTISNEFKMLRGDATLTVTIPKTGDEPGTIKGTLNNFKEWTAAGWTAYGTDFNVSLTSADIMDFRSVLGQLRQQQAESASNTQEAHSRGRSTAPATTAPILKLPELGLQVTAGG